MEIGPVPKGGCHETVPLLGCSKESREISRRVPKGKDKRDRLRLADRQGDNQCRLDGGKEAAFEFLATPNAVVLEQAQMGSSMARMQMDFKTLLSSEDNTESEKRGWRQRERGEHG